MIGMKKEHEKMMVMSCGALPLTPWCICPRTTARRSQIPRSCSNWVIDNVGEGDEAKAKSNVEVLFAIGDEKLEKNVHVTQNVLNAVLCALQRLLLLPHGIPHLQWKRQRWEQGGACWPTGARCSTPEQHSCFRTPR